MRTWPTPRARAFTVLRAQTVLVYVRHEALNNCDCGLQPAPIGCRGLLLAGIRRFRLEDVFAPLDQKPFLVSEASGKLLEPFQDLDVVIAHVASIAEKARGCQGHDGNDWVHAGDEEGLVPGEVRQRLVPRSQMLQVVLAIRGAICDRSIASAAVAWRRP